MELFFYIVILISICSAAKSCFESLLKNAILLNIPIKSLAAVSRAHKISSLLCLSLTVSGIASAQTPGLSYWGGSNAGNPATKHAPITEIIDFRGYNDSLASSPDGQTFLITLISGHKLHFNLKKEGSIVNAVSAPTFSNASMGAVPTYKPPSIALPALYSPEKPCTVTFLFSDIKVFKPDGLTLVPSQNIIIIDAESTNKNANAEAEIITGITNGQPWMPWDLITTTTNNPIQSGLGTKVVDWLGASPGTTGAYAIATQNADTISVHLDGAKQGIALAIQSFIGDKVTEICSGSPVDVVSPDLFPSSNVLYTWPEPMISDDAGHQISGNQIISGGVAQAIKVPYGSQILINHTEAPLTVTYIVTPHDESGTELASFTVKVKVNPIPKASILYPGSYCTRGLAEVRQTGQSGGIYSSDSGLRINPQTGSVDLQSSTSGKHTITYVFDNGSCIDSVTTTIDISQVPAVLIADPPAICDPGSIDLRSPAITAGSTPGLIFSYWKDENASVPLSDPSAVSENGVYYIKGTTTTGCWEIKPVHIVIRPCQPHAADDTYYTTEDILINIGTPGILLNDSDPNPDPLTAILVTGTHNGKLSINPDGSFTYDPDPNFHGTDTFTYKVSDGALESNIATVTIIVRPVNDPPLAVDDRYLTTEDTPIVIAAPGILLNDSDPDADTITAVLLTEPENGTLTINPDGSFTYTPKPGFQGADRFTYKVNDGDLESNIATVIITITSTNQPPVAADDSFELIDNALEGRINLNDYDPDGDPLVYSIITNPEHGEIQIDADGSFRYLPDPGFTDIDYFVYRTCDSEGLCAEAKVFLSSRPSTIVSLTPSQSTIPEGSKVTITAVLSQPFPYDVRVTLNYNGDAQDGKDYTLFENFVTIDIPAGRTTAAEYFIVAALIDDLNEKEEHILISISDVNSDRVTIGSGADVSIINLYPPSKEITEEPSNTDIKPDPLISPNGDGQGNERFMIDKIELYPDNIVLIFNRWGNEVYRIHSYNNDENSFQGVANTGILTNTNKNLPEGVYYYLIHTTDSDKKKKLNKGYLILKR